jgi:intracellular septation protein
MKFLFDIFPVVLFFLIFRWGDAHPGTAHDLVNQYLSAFMSNGAAGEHAPILLATAVAIVATVAQVAFQLIRRKSVGITLWITVVVIILFGGMTIYFNDENFIKWKPTILYWCFATALAGSKLILKKNAIRALMEEQFALPDRIWDKLNLAWIVFFACMGLLNLFVAFVLFKDNNGAWVDFKLASIGISFVFIIVQSIYLSKYLEDPK